MEEHALAADESAMVSHCLLKEMWQEAYGEGRSLSFRVVSGSMRPLIEVGDVVKVTRVEPSRIRMGDVVAFQERQEVVVHRIIGKKWSDQQLLFRHRGDAGAGSGTLPAQNLLGKAWIIEKGGREIVLDSPRQVMNNRILGWQLRLGDTLRRAKHKQISTGVRLALRPLWRAYRSLILERF